MALDPPLVVPAFLDLIRRRATPPGREWCEQAASAAASFDCGTVMSLFVLAARRLGQSTLSPEPEEHARLQALGVDWPIGGWGLDELGRTALLVLAGAHLPEVALQALVEDCYQHGDNRERQAVLRALPLLPQAERFLSLAVEACRTNIQPIFEAIACENPYPAAYFPELHFNQMVLKALFIGVALNRIIGLEGHVTPELRRMAEDYASERRAAGRSIPADIAYLTALTAERRSAP